MQQENKKLQIKDLVGKSWIVDDKTVLINVNGVEVFQASYNGTAGYVMADGIFEINYSKWTKDSISKINGKLPMNVEVCNIKELSTMEAVGIVKNAIHEIFNNTLDKIY